MLNSYFSLHNHSDYSNAALGFSDCINKIPDLIQRAYDIGLSGLALTDHECISGYIQALNYYEKMTKDRPFKLALGNEIYLLTDEEYNSNRYDGGTTPYYHCILVALDTEGYHQLCKLSTRAWTRAWMKSVYRRPTLYSDLADIIKPNQGHVICSTACLGSRLDHLLMSNDFTGANREINRLIEIFGKDNLYIECQPPKDDACDQAIVNNLLYNMASFHDLPMIVTTDSHYLRKEDALIHKIFLNSQDGDREVEDFYATAYMMSPTELREYLSVDFSNEQIDEMYANTNAIFERIKDYDIRHNPIIPQLPIEKIPAFEIKNLFQDYYSTHPNFNWYAHRTEIHERFFFFQIEVGLFNKIVSKGKNIETYIDRLEIEWNELKKISEALGNSMVSYYSTMAELINLMWNVGSFVGAGRGSSAGFLTTYLLDITQVDPVPLGDYLPWWRHVALERGAEIADIDTDSEPCKKYAIINAVKDYFGEDKVLNVATFGVVSSKTAIERACRGLGISNDVAGYLKSLIPVNRGKVAELKDCLYGEEKVAALKAEIDKYDNLEKCALGICGVVCQRGLHAAGLCISNEPYVNYLGAMRAPNGTMCTSFNLWDSEAVSLVKFDLLTVEALQKMHKAMDAMLADGVIEWQGSVRATYNKYLHPDVIDFETKEMWDSISKMYSCFQWDTPISTKALAQIKPQNIMDLSAGNSLIRLMPEGRSETPLDTYVRYKEHPEQWEIDAKAYGLNDEEMAVVREYCEDAHYLADCQEKIMRLSQDPRIAGYSLKNSNKLRKAIAKKDEKLQEEAKALFFECGHKQGARDIFLHYVWDVLFSASFGYAFSSIHSYVYSIIALQELNMYYHYNPVYWNVGCLQSETSADDEGSGSSTDYGKIAKAIYKMKAFGIDVDAPNINQSNLDYTANAKQDTILYGIAGIASINSDIANQIISNRPYSSFENFYQKNTYQGSLVTKSKIIQLIKAGCFDCFEPNRKKVMVRYAKLLYTNKSTLELNNIAEIKRLGIQLPIEVIAPYNFKKYVTSKQFYYSDHPKFKSKKIYRLDDKAKAYFMKNCIGELTEGVDYWYEDAVESIVIVDKSIEKTLKKRIEAIKEYINTPKFLDDFRVASVKQIYRDLVDDNFNVNHWSFEATSYYSSGQHELASVRLGEYNIDHFASLPVDPVFVEKSYGEKTWRQYNLNCIAGTVLDKNDNNHLVTILTADNEVVNIKFNGNDYAYYKSALENDKPWIKRGNLLMISGYRRGENDFVAKKYKSSIYPSLIQKIVHIYDDGDMDIITKREQEVEE